MLIRAERHFAGKSHHCWLLLPILYHAISPLHSESDSDTHEKFEDTCFTKLKHYTFRHSGYNKIQARSSSERCSMLTNKQQLRKRTEMQTIQVSKVSRFLVVCFNLIILRREFETFKISVSFLWWEEKRYRNSFFLYVGFSSWKYFRAKFSCWLAQCIVEKREPGKMWNIFGKNKKNIVRPKRREKRIRKKMFDEEAAWLAKNSCLHFITINNIKFCPLLFLRCVAFLTLSQSAQLSTSFLTSRLRGTLDSSLYAAEGKLSDFQFKPNPQKPFTAVVFLLLSQKSSTSAMLSLLLHCHFQFIALCFHV